MINTYDTRVGNPEYFKQFSVKDILVVYYECPQVDKHVNIFTHYNEIVYTISGKKILHHNGKSWVLTDNLSLFIRRTAYRAEMAHMVGWKVLAFNFQDEFLKQAFKEYRPYLTVAKMANPPQDMLVQIHVDDTAKAFFQSIIPYFSQRIPPAENLLELKFKELFVYHLFGSR